MVHSSLERARLERARERGGELANEELYDRLYKSGYHAGLTLSHAHHFVRLIGRDASISSVLDVGCSHGLAVASLWALNVTASGVDVSRVAVDLASSSRRGEHRCHASFCFRQARASNLSFVADRAFDAVLSTDVLEHLQPSDVHAALDELTRVAAKKLFLKVAPHQENNRVGALLARAGVAAAQRPEQLHSFLRPRTWWVRELTRRGFELEWATSDQSWLGRGQSFVMRRIGVAAGATDRGAKARVDGLLRAQRFRSKTGLCGPTPSGPSDCALGDRGSWGVDAEKIKSMAACVARCTACSRCNYVSLSLAPAHAECAWYAACDMAHLTAPPESGTDYETVHVVKMR